VQFGDSNDPKSLNMSQLTINMLEMNKNVVSLAAIVPLEKKRHRLPNESSSGSEGEEFE
jgi:hypothetical protein